MYFAPLIPIILFLIFLGFFKFFEKIKERKRIKNLSSKNQIKVIKDLEALLKQAKSLDIEKYHKERIIDSIESEMRVIKREIIESLGTEIFDKLRKEE